MIFAIASRDPVTIPILQYEILDKLVTYIVGCRGVCQQGGLVPVL